MTTEVKHIKEVICIPSLRVIKIEVSEDQNGNPQQTEVRKPEIKKAPHENAGLNQN